MGIRYIKGDLLNSDAQALVNTVNCVGVMGKGIAKQFKTKFPDNYKRYKHACDNKTLQPGSLFTTVDVKTKKTIINFPTKNHWRNPSQLEWIVQGLTSLRELLENMNMSVALPPLGCGNGGLNWELDVHPLVINKLGDLPMDIQVYGPNPKRGMRVLVTGGRDFNNVSQLRHALTYLNPDEIIHGAARGADSLAGEYARHMGIVESPYPADWNTHGKAAGPIRNEQMLHASKPDIVLAMPGGNGTKHMMDTAHKFGYPVIKSNEAGNVSFDTRVHNMRNTNNECPPGFVRVDRATTWGNPFKDEDTGILISKYEDYLRYKIKEDRTLPFQIAQLAGRTLACWCSPNPCHAAVLAHYAGFYCMIHLPQPEIILNLYK